MREVEFDTFEANTTRVEENNKAHSSSPCRYTRPVQVACQSRFQNTKYSSSVDLRNEKLWCWTRGIGKVQKVGRSDVQGAFANFITVVTEHLELFRGKSFNASVVLLVLRVAKQNHARDVLLHGCIEIGDGCGDDSSTLAATSKSVRSCSTSYRQHISNSPVATGHYRSIGTLLGC